MPAPSRLPSPKEQQLMGSIPSFPFAAFSPSPTAHLVSKLPPREEAKAFTDAYFRYFAWQWVQLVRRLGTDFRYDVVPRSYYEPIFERVYATLDGSNTEAVNPQELALLYIVFAMGALYSLELPPNDPVAMEYHTLSKACLVKGNFLVNNAISGVQTLVGPPPSSCAHTKAHHGSLPPVSTGGREALTTGRRKKDGVVTQPGHCGAWRCA